MNHWLDVGEILVDFDVVDNWHCELNKMNEGKKAGSLTDIQIHLFNFCRRYDHYIKHWQTLENQLRAELYNDVQ